VAIDVDAPAGGYLVLTDSYDPSWRAQIEGVEVPVLRADGMFRAVQLQPGARRVVFSYQPVSVSLGATISAATLVLVIVCALSCLLLHLRARSQG
jgi:uncharacterized membrane protein YfhO